MEERKQRRRGIKARVGFMCRARSGSPRAQQIRIVKFLRTCFAGLFVW